MNGRSDSQLYELVLRYRIPLLMFLGAVLYVAFIGLRDVWYPDEPDIAEVTRAMFLSGDWISPRRMGVIWVDYPPMIYWIGTISSHLLGEMSAFSLRLPNAIAALATVLLVSMAGKRWFDAATAFWAGFCLLTFMSFVYEGNSYRPDVTFALAITAGFIAYASGSGDQPRLWLRGLGFVFFGVAMLAKGPLGLLLPGLVLVLWLGTHRKWWNIVELAPLSLLALAVYLPWFVATAQAMGWGEMAYEFYAQNFERFLTAENRGHAQPWYYFLKNFWTDFMPWSWLFPLALWSLYRSGELRQPRLQLALWWFGTFFVFLSLAATKRQLYLLPAYPAAALLLGYWFASVCRKRDVPQDPDPARFVRGCTLFIAVLNLLAGAAFLIAAWRLPQIAASMELNEQQVQVAANLRMPFAILGIAFLGGAVWMATAWRRSAARHCLASIGGSHVAIYVVILSLVMPAIAPIKTYRPQSEWISEQIGDATHFGMADPAGVLRRGGFAYYTGTGVDLLDSTEEVEAFFRRHPGSIVLIRDSFVETIFAGDEAAWRERILREIRVGRHLYVAVGDGSE